MINHYHTQGTIETIPRKSNATLTALQDLYTCKSLAELCKRGEKRDDRPDPALNFATRSKIDTRPVMPARDQMFTHRDGGERRRKMRAR